jgi:hypothetical protein
MAQYSFPALPVHDHAGATLNFEQLAGTLTELETTTAHGKGDITEGDLSRPFLETFLRLAVSGTVKVNYGKAEVEWTSGTLSKQTTVKTGVTAPSTAYYFTQPTGELVSYYMQVQAPNLKEFKVQANSPGGAPTGGTKQPFYWLAITF